MKKARRTALLMILGGFLILYLTSCVSKKSFSATEETNEPSLKTLGEINGLEWGTAIMPLGMDDEIYKDTMAQQFDFLIPDYGMYMSQTQPEKGVWTFGDMDEIVRYAQANDMRVRGHILVWALPVNSGGLGSEGFQPTPDWVQDGDFSREELIEIMGDHIETVMARYSGTINEWVVVNEAVGGFQLDEMIDNVWLRGIGKDYVELAFRRAHEVDPDAYLILSDYGADFVGQLQGGREKVSNFYNFVKKLVAKGVPIDAVGLQFHLIVGVDYPFVDSIVQNLTSYRDLGLDACVTELDVRMSEPITADKLERQALIYATVTQAVLEADTCDSISVFGFSDKYSWITTFNIFPGYTAATIMDSEFKTRESYWAILDAMQEHQK